MWWQQSKKKVILLLWHIRNGLEFEYRDQTEALSDWSHKNCLLPNTSKTKEKKVDFTFPNTKVLNSFSQVLLQLYWLFSILQKYSVLPLQFSICKLHTCLEVLNLFQCAVHSLVHTIWDKTMSPEKFKSSIFSASRYDGMDTMDGMHVRGVMDASSGHYMMRVTCIQRVILCYCIFTLTLYVILRHSSHSSLLVWTHL